MVPLKLIFHQPEKGFPKMLSKPIPTLLSPRDSPFSHGGISRLTPRGTHSFPAGFPPCSQLSVCPSSPHRSRTDAGIGPSFPSGHKTLSSCQLSTSTTCPHQSQDSNITSRSALSASFEPSYGTQALRLQSHSWPILSGALPLSAARTAGLCLLGQLLLQPLAQGLQEPMIY